MMRTSTGIAGLAFFVGSVMALMRTEPKPTSPFVASIAGPDSVTLHAPTLSTIRITNTLRDRSVMVLGLASSCGCIRLETARFALGPGGSADVPVTIEATSMDRRQSAIVWIDTDEGRFGAPVEIDVDPPVSGWPDRVEAWWDPRESSLMVGCSPRSVASLENAVVYRNGRDAADTVGMVARGARGAELVIPASAPGAEPMELAIDIDGVRWCRPVVVVDPPTQERSRETP